MIKSTLLFGTVCLLAMQASAMPLVKDGKPVGEFVLPEPAAGAEVFVAN